MEFSELVLKRRSVRAYTGELLTRAQAEAILDAGLRAPNACNYQSWHFYALVGRDAAELLYPEVYSAPWFEKIGMAVVATVDPSIREIVSGPEIVSRGFVYVRDSEEMMDQAKKVAYDAINRSLDGNGCDWAAMKTAAKEKLSKFLYEATGRSPMILPIILSL